MPWANEHVDTNELADRLIAAAERLHVREIDDRGAYLGLGIAVADLVRDLDEALRSGQPLPARWANAVG